MSLSYNKNNFKSNLMMDNRNTEKPVPSHWHKQNIGHHDMKHC